MKQFDLPISFEDPAVTLTAFPVEEVTRRPALLVLPGGGYMICAPGEGAPVAARFAELGYAAFVLNYSVQGLTNPAARFPNPLREVARTVQYLRSNADALGIDPDRIYLFGSSAGGHLAASYGNHWTDTALFGDIAEPSMLQPNALVLLYGATEFDQNSMMLPSMFGHPAPYTEEELERWMVRLHLNAHTPPTVLFHSAPDPTVPMEQSLRLFTALQALEIPSALHIFGSGEHAYGLGTGTPAEVWPDLADRFLQELWKAPGRFNRGEMLLHKAQRHKNA